MQSKLTFQVQPEPREFSLTFDGGTSDPTVVYDKAHNMESFLSKLKAGQWEVEKGHAEEIEPARPYRWMYEIFENEKVIDGNLGFDSKEEAEASAKQSIDYITRNDPRRIEVCIWPERGGWCHLADKEEHIANGYGQDYFIESFNVMVVWNPEHQKCEIEPDQDYYINIEVDDLIKQMQIVQVAKMGGGDGSLKAAVEAISTPADSLNLK